jgi:hypothetical protein
MPAGTTGGPGEKPPPHAETRDGIESAAAHDRNVRTQRTHRRRASHDPACFHARAPNMPSTRANLAPRQRSPYYSLVGTRPVLSRTTSEDGNWCTPPPGVLRSSARRTS